MPSWAADVSAMYLASEPHRIAFSYASLLALLLSGMDFLSSRSPPSEYMQYNQFD